MEGKRVGTMYLLSLAHRPEGPQPKPPFHISSPEQVPLVVRGRVVVREEMKLNVGAGEVFLVKATHTIQLHGTRFIDGPDQNPVPVNLQEEGGQVRVR